MPEERRYFVICEDNCKFESMTKEQIIEAIAEATGETPVHIDDAFITKIKELNANNQLKWWVGTEAQYNALEEKDLTTLYIIYDASEYDDLLVEIQELQAQIEALNEKAPMYQYSTTDLEPGVSDLETGTLYFVYEE